MQEPEFDTAKNRNLFFLLVQESTKQIAGKSVRREVFLHNFVIPVLPFYRQKKILLSL